jgi:hypothetical protein
MLAIYLFSSVILISILFDIVDEIDSSAIARSMSIGIRAIALLIAFITILAHFE